MDTKIQKLTTPEQCDILERNALAKGHNDLATKARVRATELLAEKYGARTAAEKECLQAVYAYERVLTDRNRRTTRASRTWPMIERLGIIPAVEKIVKRPEETAGYRALVEKGLQDFAFEAVIIRYPDAFSPEALRTSQERIRVWRA